MPGNTRWRFHIESIANGKKGDYPIPDFERIEGFFERLPGKTSSVLFVPVFGASQYRNTMS
ncbi:hypothetical protein HYY72_00835 [Candidatus Woesearchaeota archaeon]|nr:hypothetical protein [Candidatus Woesearchaeota archaeon]